jgi:hypothetical protein
VEKTGASQPLPAEDTGQQVAADASYAGSAENRVRQSLGQPRAAGLTVPGRDAMPLGEYAPPAAGHGHPASSGWRWPGFPLNTLLGAGAGAVIGHQRHRAWEGAAIGAAAGMLVDGLLAAQRQQQSTDWPSRNYPPHYWHYGDRYWY